MLSIGAQWAVLQGVAWVGMAVAYSLEEGSVSEGLSKTFDGEHPCPLCEVVEKGTQEENGSDDPAQNHLSKLKVEICQAERVRLNPPPIFRLPTDSLDLRAAPRASAPDSQPPEEIA